jgi:hypothetical protein
MHGPYIVAMRVFIKQQPMVNFENNMLYLLILRNQQKIVDLINSKGEFYGVFSGTAHK